jgi:hypothetical protein
MARSGWAGAWEVPVGPAGGSSRCEACVVESVMEGSGDASGPAAVRVSMGLLTLASVSSAPALDHLPASAGRRAGRSRGCRRHLPVPDELPHGCCRCQWPVAGGHRGGPGHRAPAGLVRLWARRPGTRRDRLRIAPPARRGGLVGADRGALGPFQPPILIQLVLLPSPRRRDRRACGSRGSGRRRRCRGRSVTVL